METFNINLENLLDKVLNSASFTNKLKFEFYNLAKQEVIKNKPTYTLSEYKEVYKNYSKLEEYPSPYPSILDFWNFVDENEKMITDLGYAKSYIVKKYPPAIIQDKKTKIWYENEEIKDGDIEIYMIDDYYDKNNSLKISLSENFELVEKIILYSLFFIDKSKIPYFFFQILKIQFDNEIKIFQEFFNGLFKKYGSLIDYSPFDKIFSKDLEENLNNFLDKYGLSFDSINQKKYIAELENKIKELEETKNDIKFKFQNGSFTITQLTHLINFLFYYRNNIPIEQVSISRRSESLLNLISNKKMFKGNQFEHAFNYNYRIGRANNKNDKIIIIKYLENIGLPEIINEFEDYYSRFMKTRKINKK